MASNSRIEELSKRLEKEPASRLFAQLAEELRKEGELVDAIRVSREGLTKHPNYPSARMTLGRALFDTGDLAGAQAEFDTVLKSAPDNILAARYLAECYEGLGELDRAAAQYQQALRLAPGDKAMTARLDGVERARRGDTTPAAPAAVATAGPGSSPAIGAPALRPAASAPQPAVAAGRVSGVSAPRAAVPAPAAEPPPIPLVAADEEFELERPFDAATLRMATPSPAPPGSAMPSLSPDVDTSGTLPRVVAGPRATPPAMWASEAPAAVAPPPPTALVARPPAEEEETARFLAIDEDPGGATVAMPSAVAKAAASPRPAAAPPPVAPPVPAESPGDSSGQRRAGLDTLFRFSALEEPSSPEAEIPKPTPFVPAEPGRLSASEGAEIVSPTMAELYFSQGHLDKAIEVYRKLLRGGVENERGRLRLIELEALQRQQKAVPPAVAAPQSEAAREERRAAILKTIARLESLLAVLKRSA